jgi:anti-sigma regulatory factor (Ser/Thr protein kinase)
VVALSGPAAGRYPSPHVRYQVRAEEDVGAARRAAGRVAAAAGIRAAEVEIVAAELATNILRHAGGDGYLLCQAGPGHLELVAADRGPGLGPGALLPSPADSLASWPSGAGGLGVGLASVRRLASEFDYSSGPAGTVMLARFGDPRRSWPGLARWGAVNVPLGGAGESGDAWLVSADGRCLAALVVDGLGHGPGAAAASAAAISALAGRPVTDPADCVLRAHEAMRGTRGGVLGIAVVDPERGELLYAGVGNIAGWVLNGGTCEGLLSREGAAGTQARPPRPHLMRLRWQAGATLILASDGIRTLRDLRSYRGLFGHDPEVAAAVLYRDHERGTDDATMLVVQDVRRGEP